MGRILFWVILIAAIAIAWSLSRRRNALSNKEREELARLRGALRAREADRRSGEGMRCCPVCGVYFPEKTGVWRKDACYCSDECRRKAEEQA